MGCLVYLNLGLLLFAFCQGHRDLENHDLLHLIWTYLISLESNQDEGLDFPEFIKEKYGRRSHKI